MTLSRLWCPVPRWRHRRIPLDQIALAEHDMPVSDSGTATDITFRIHRCGGHRDRALWLCALRSVWQPLWKIEWQPRAFRSEAEPILTGWRRRVHGLPSLDREPYFAATPTVG